MNIPAYFAIRNKRNKKFVSGSDYRYFPPHCIMADEYRTPLILTSFNLKNELQKRKINLKRYEVVLITINPYEKIEVTE